jgi:hypothetical protein
MEALTKFGAPLEHDGITTKTFITASFRNCAVPNVMRRQKDGMRRLGATNPNRAVLSQL